MAGVLQGIITTRDLVGLDNMKAPVTAFMTPVAKIVCAMEPITDRQARERMKAEKVGKLPIVNKSNELMGLMTRGNTKRIAGVANVDQNNQLVVGAAVGCNDDHDFDRAAALVGGGVD